MYALDAREIFDASVNAVQPGLLIPKHLDFHDNHLKAGNFSFQLSHEQKIILIAAGKAAPAMAIAAEKILGKNIFRALSVTKYNHCIPLQYCDCFEAGHPVPDENSVLASEKMLGVIDGAGPDDLILLLLSGGASSLITDLPQRIPLEDIKMLNQILLKAGAGIYELNSVRKHLSLIKGGQMSRRAYPATIVTLVLSDVSGDELSTIASGPTVADPTTFGDAMAVINKYAIKEKLPRSITGFLERGTRGEIQETPKPGDPIFRKSFTSVIGSSKTAVDAASSTAIELGYAVQLLPGEIAGEARNRAGEFLDVIKEYNGVRPACFIWSGEPTVTVRGDGIGGRCQEFVLAALTNILNQPDQFNKIPVILAAGTDGSDGDTEAAGAILDENNFQKVRSLGLDPSNYLERNDSYNFFKKAGGLLITGPTHTNVRDMIIAIV